MLVGHTSPNKFKLSLKETLNKYSKNEAKTFHIYKLG